MKIKIISIIYEFNFRFTKQGSLKDSTFCAPNNGYYFLPLYDKGEYYLRVCLL